MTNFVFAHNYDKDRSIFVFFGSQYITKNDEASNNCAGYGCVDRLEKGRARAKLTVIPRLWTGYSVISYHLSKHWLLNNTQRTMRCHCKFQYVSNFAMALWHRAVFLPQHTYLHRPTSAIVQMLKLHTVHWFLMPTQNPGTSRERYEQTDRRHTVA